MQMSGQCQPVIQMNKATAVALEFSID
jgi:hypothetical protein